MKAMTRGVAAGAAALLVALGAAACSSSSGGGGTPNNGGTNGSSPAPAPSTNSGGGTSGLTAEDINAQPVSALKQGGTLIWGLDQYSTQWNLNEIDGSESSTQNVMGALMPSPYVSDSKGNITPNTDYVQSWKVVSSKPQVIEYKLNPKAVWSDGTPITEKDYAVQWQAMNGKTKAYQAVSNSGYNQISSVTEGKGGKFDVVVKYSTPYTDWKGVFSPLYPASEQSSPDKFNKAYLNAIPVTAGPFANPQFDKSAKTVTVTPNPKWWGNKPMLDKIVFKAEAATALNQAYVNGEIDYDFDVTVDPTDYKAVKAASNGHVTLAAGPDYRQFTFNTTHGFMTDPKVVDAMWIGTERTAIIKSDLTGIPWPAVPLDNHFYVNSQQGYQDNMGDLGVYNPDKAKQLLTSDGFTMQNGLMTKNGKAIEATFVIPAGYQSSKNEGELFQAMMKNIGIKVTIKTVPGDSFFTDYVEKQQFDVTPFSWLGTPFTISSNESIFLSAKDGGGQNWTGVSNPQVDRLLKQAVAEPDTAKATALANQADKLIYQGHNTFTMFQRPQMCGVKNGLANLGSFGFATIDYTKIGYTK